MLRLIVTCLIGLTALACSGAGEERAGGASGEPSPTSASTPVATATAAATPSATPTANPTPQAATVEQWAASVCAGAQALQEATAAAADSVDPRTLTLAQRKERARRLERVWSQALADWRARLASVVPPAGARAYHEALAEEARTTGEAMTVSIGAIEAATSVAEVDAANARLNAAAQQGAEQVLAARQGLPGEAVSALRAVARCGNLTAD